MAINLVSLNSVELTDEGRTFNRNLDQRMVEVELASGKIKRYIKAEKNTWSLSWENIPQDASKSFDGKGARDEIKSIAFLGTAVPLRTRNTYGVEEVYTVFVDDYDEEIVRRDYSGGVFLYRVNLSLKEQ